MANSIVLNKKIILPTRVIWEFLVTLSGNYTNGGAVGTPGETLDFNAATNPNYIERPKIPAGSPAGKLPPTTDFETINQVNGYVLQVEQNAASPTPHNYAGRLFTAAGTELATGAIPAGAKAAAFVVQVSAKKRYD